jgi:hypothetical protein
MKQPRREEFGSSQKSIDAQLPELQTNFDQMRVLAELQQKQLDALKVCAGIDGVLVELPLHVGEHVSPGAMLARVGQPNHLMAELKIRETQARDVQNNEPVSVDTHTGVIAGIVGVDPAVQNGTVSVDVKLTSALPEGAQPNLSVDGTIDLERLDNVLYCKLSRRMNVARAEAEVSRRDQELTVARRNLQLQETLMKNAITKSLDDPALEAMPVVPTDRMESVPTFAAVPIQDRISTALKDRPQLAESEVDLVNRRISRSAARKALLPSLSFVGFYGGSGIAGRLNPAFSGTNSSSVPTDFGGALLNAFNGIAPDYYLGFDRNIPIRNRVAKPDQYRSELEYRQAELRLEQLKTQARIEVPNAPPNVI